MRKDQYLIKQAYRKPIIFHKLSNRGNVPAQLNDTSSLVKGELTISGVSLMDSNVVAAILQNYSKLKQDSYDRFEGDTWYLIQAFEDLADTTLKDQPILQRILEYKIDGKQNVEIQLLLKEEFGTTYTPEYLSAVWCKKIPKLIAEEAQKDYVIWQTRLRKLPEKKCSKCGQNKPKHSLFFSKSNTSKDFFYSICKDCRKAKYAAGRSNTTQGSSSAQ